jgi:hypothetical protein
LSFFVFVLPNEESVLSVGRSGVGNIFVCDFQVQLMDEAETAEDAGGRHQTVTFYRGRVTNVVGRFFVAHSTRTSLHFVGAGVVLREDASDARKWNSILIGACR